MVCVGQIRPARCMGGQRVRDLVCLAPALESCPSSKSDDFGWTGGDVGAAAITGAGSGASVFVEGWCGLVRAGAGWQWRWLSGRRRDLKWAGEPLGSLRERPGPVLGQAQEHLRWPRVIRAAVCSSRYRRILGSARCNSCSVVSSIVWVRASRSAAIRASSTQTSLMFWCLLGRCPRPVSLPDRIRLDPGVRTMLSFEKGEQAAAGVLPPGAVTGDDRTGPARCRLHLRSATPRCVCLSRSKTRSPAKTGTFALPGPVSEPKIRSLLKRQGELALRAGRAFEERVGAE